MKFFFSIISFFKPVKNDLPVKNYDTFLGLDLDSFLAETIGRKSCSNEIRL